jgi:hypothetical protein
MVPQSRFSTICQLDNGPQFDAAEFKDYCAANIITPLNSSKCFPISNGLAEAAVKSVKYLLLKSDNYRDLRIG